MVKSFVFLLIIALSSAWLYLLHYIRPDPDDSGDNVIDWMSVPSNMDELKSYASAMKTYSVNHWWYVLLIFSTAYLYKQAFCIPGSMLLNMLAGALYGTIGGFLFTCIFTATGATICYLLSKTFAKDLVSNFFPQKIQEFQQKVKSNEDRLFYFMLFIRIVSVTPGWLINIASPIVSIPLKTFYLSTLIGLGPYNLVGVTAGRMLSSLESVDEAYPWRLLLNISVLGFGLMGPAILLKAKKAA